MYFMPVLPSCSRASLSNSGMLIAHASPRAEDVRVSYLRRVHLQPVDVAEDSVIALPKVLRPERTGPKSLRKDSSTSLATSTDSRSSSGARSSGSKVSANPPPGSSRTSTFPLGALGARAAAGALPAP